MNNKLILMRGISGCGKSTLAKSLVKDGVIFSTDEFFMESGLYIFDPEKLHHYHSLNVSRTRQAMVDGITPIVIDNTNLVFREMKPYVELAKNYGYQVEVAQIDLDDIDVLLERQSNRVESGKVLSREILERMKNRFDKNWRVLLKDYL